MEAGTDRARHALPNPRDRQRRGTDDAGTAAPTRCPDRPREGANWRNLESNDGSVAAQVTAANQLEALGRRLVVAARAAPRLTGKPALASVCAYASSAPPDAAPFEAAVSHYERERNRPARRLAAGILGYKSVPAYDASGTG